MVASLNRENRDGHYQIGDRVTGDGTFFENALASNINRLISIGYVDGVGSTR